MTGMEWLAVLGAGLAGWLLLPPDGLVRLRGTVLRLPQWARPRPGAMSSRRRWWMAGSAGAAVVFFGWDASAWMALAGPVVAVAGWVVLGQMEPAGTRRHRVETIYALPQGLDLLQTCLAAGQPLRNAVAIVADAMGPPVGPLLGNVTNAISVGLSDAQAWQGLQEDPVIGPLARDLARSAAWGTETADVLAQHAVDLRRRGRIERLAAAKAVGVKSVLPLGVCYLPAFMLLGVVPTVAAGMASVLR